MCNMRGCRIYKLQERIRVNLGSGKFPYCYHIDCFVLFHGDKLKRLNEKLHLFEVCQKTIFDIVKLIYKNQIEINKNLIYVKNNLGIFAIDIFDSPFYRSSSVKYRDHPLCIRVACDTMTRVRILNKFIINENIKKIMSRNSDQVNALIKSKLFYILPVIKYILEDYRIDRSENSLRSQVKGINERTGGGER